MSIVIKGIEFSDEVNSRGEMELETDSELFYMDKEDAIELIDHLREVFEL